MFSKYKKTEFNQFWIFTFLVASILMLPAIFQRGMFLDGVTYAAISKNLANNFGTFFKPIYTKTLLNPFYEHPPLAFWIQSVFFKFFGDFYFIEKLYSLLTGVGTCWGILLLWNSFFEIKKHNWLVVFIWITIPIVFWSYTNNMLENSLGFFTIFSVYFIVKFLKNGNLFYLLLSAFLIVFAFLSKGFVGLFPLVTPLIYTITLSKNFKKNMIINSKLIIMFSVVFLLILSFFIGLKDNLLKNIETQLLPALYGKREITVSYRLKIIVELIIELSLPLLILIVTFFSVKTRNIQYKKESLFFILIGISASLPLIISMKQRKFYLIPSFPFYIIGLSLIIIPLLEPQLKLLYSKRKKIVRNINILLLFALLVVFFKSDGFLRDKDQIKDIKKISKILKEGDIISTTKSFNKDYLTVAYFSREKYISLTDKLGNYYFLKRKNEVLDKKLETKFVEVDLKLGIYNLYKEK